MEKLMKKVELLEQKLVLILEWMTIGELHYLV